MQNYDVIGIEDTALANMTRSAAGTAEEPGKNVAQKSGLNRSILEQNLGQVRQQLAYKAEWAGRRLVLVDPRNTTRTCSRCGSLNDRPGANRIYRCDKCGLVIDQTRMLRSTSCTLRWMLSAWSENANRCSLSTACRS